VIRTRTLTITEDMIRAYSRRGNYHSDAATASALGLPGLVAQGLQVAGPAYGELLDAWGEEFLAYGEIELRFVGTVLAGDTVDARVELSRDNDSAAIEITNTTRVHAVVVGTAQRAQAPH
jgi:acyl dehydratase